MRNHNFLGLLLLGAILSSCGAYRQNIMFKTTAGDPLKQQVAQAESNYTIQKNDLLQLQVYTNKGEKIVDPDLESYKESAQRTSTVSEPPSYLVDIKGFVKFPQLELLSLEGLTIRQAEEVLQKAYSQYYRDNFVVLKISNKRVVVLGAPGGQVIPLVNENVRLTEILALAKGINNDAKAKNIRVLRGDTVLIADFRTFDGYKKGNFLIEPGDIIYVEPVRRPFTEALREYIPIVSIITSLATLVFIFTQNNNN